jgi:hypothetical protein
MDRIAAPSFFLFKILGVRLQDCSRTPCYSLSGVQKRGSVKPAGSYQLFKNLLGQRLGQETGEIDGMKKYPSL